MPCETKEQSKCLPRLTFVGLAISVNLVRPSRFADAASIRTELGSSSRIDSSSQQSEVPSFMTQFRIVGLHTLNFQLLPPSNFINLRSLSDQALSADKRRRQDAYEDRGMADCYIAVQTVRE